MDGNDCRRAVRRRRRESAELSGGRVGGRVFVLRDFSSSSVTAMALNGGLRSCAKLLSSSGSLVPKPVSRQIHSTGTKRMGGHAHGHDEPEYIHAKHMYNLDKMKYRQIKMPLFVFSCFAIGAFVPVYAVMFQQKKTSSVSN
ncbi:hypothetical protein V2J09_013927 [Rumex salicifolius]